MSKNQKPEKYLIRHTSGSKNNQVDEFNFEKKVELTFGRSSTNDIQFDPEEDAVVSREHGIIIRENDVPYVFKIKDNNSRNGIFVNKQKVVGETIIKPGDEIQLGSNGPTFEFDLYPLPADMIAATRLIDTSKPTQEMSITENMSSEEQKATVGKQTVERLLQAERGKSNKTLVASIIGVLIVLSAIGFVFRDSIFKGDTVFQRDSVIVNNTIDSKSVIEASDIAAKNRKSIVLISFSWRLYLTSTNDALWHEYKAVENPQTGGVSYIPLFVQLPDGSVEPKLTTNNNVPVLPIGVDGATGSGFVITKDGWILTNSHVASNWHTAYRFKPDIFPGLLVLQDGSISKGQVYSSDVAGWIPAETKQFGYNPTNKTVSGKNTYLNVTFADNDTPIPVVGEPIPSPEHDVALMKVNSPQELTFMELDENSEVKIGQPIMIMGYPGASPKTYSVVTSKNYFNPANQVRILAKPTSTPGDVTNIIEGGKLQGNERLTSSSFGDVIQLQANTGGGNSGGPVINKEGKVIGIYFASNNISGATPGFAVPIKYGVKLLKISN